MAAAAWPPAAPTAACTSCAPWVVIRAAATVAPARQPPPGSAAAVEAWRPRRSPHALVVAAASAGALGGSRAVVVALAASVQRRRRRRKLPSARLQGQRAGSTCSRCSCLPELLQGQEPIIRAVEALPASGGKVLEIDEVTPGPGLLNRHLRLRCRSGEVFMAKVSRGPAITLEAEKAGLEALLEASEGLGITMPKPYTVGLLDFDRGSFLVMDFLRFVPFGASIPQVIERLGHGLASLHSRAPAAMRGPLLVAPAGNVGAEPGAAAARGSSSSSASASSLSTPYGFHGGQETFLGSWPQDNTPGEDYAEFFVERRLRPQLERANLKFQFRYGTTNEASTAMARLYDRVLERALKVLHPVRHCQPSLLHGDLWTGNCGASPSRTPILIDPACWYGHAEFDLSVSQIFGRFSDRFYDAYFEVRPKEAGYEERKQVYVLYHMLNQANLHGAGFGRGGTAENPGGYLEQAIESMERLAAQA